MSNAKHTQGPWRVGGTEQRVIFADNGDVVARIACYGEQSETPEADKANARLIAAAPELLAALQWAVGFIDTYASKASGPATPELNKCRAAIVKATSN